MGSGDLVVRVGRMFGKVGLSVVIANPALIDSLRSMGLVLGWYLHTHGVRIYGIVFICPVLIECFVAGLILIKFFK